MNYQTNNLPYIIHFLFTGKILEVCWTSDTFRHLAKLAWGLVKWVSCVEPTGMNSLPANIWGTKIEDGEGNGNPLQYSCLEKPMDGGAW